MDPLLREAIERRDRLRKELAALDELIKILSELEAQREPNKHVHPADLFSHNVATRAEMREAVKRQMDAAEQFILAVGKPQTRSAILDHLQQQGMPVIGVDKSKVLGTNLWRSKRFHNIKGIGYWPKSVPIPPRFKTKAIRSSSLS
jgi:hypothetical protein